MVMSCDFKELSFDKLRQTNAGIHYWSEFIRFPLQNVPIITTNTSPSPSPLPSLSLSPSPLQDSTGRSDEDIAAETLACHTKSNNSFIQNLFQGQYRSALLCPSCNTSSCTFDPYVCVSLPLPQQETRPIYITVIYRSSSRQNKVFGVNVSINASIRDLRNGLAELCGVSR